MLGSTPPRQVRVATATTPPSSSPPGLPDAQPSVPAELMPIQSFSNFQRWKSIKRNRTQDKAKLTVPSAAAAAASQPFPPTFDATLPLSSPSLTSDSSAALPNVADAVAPPPSQEAPDAGAHECTPEQTDRARSVQELKAAKKAAHQHQQEQRAKERQVFREAARKECKAIMKAAVSASSPAARFQPRPSSRPIVPQGGVQYVAHPSIQSDARIKALMRLIRQYQRRGVDFAAFFDTLPNTQCHVLNPHTGPHLCLYPANLPDPAAAAATPLPDPTRRPTTLRIPKRDLYIVVGDGLAQLLTDCQAQRAALEAALAEDSTDIRRYLETSKQQVCSYLGISQDEYWSRVEQLKVRRAQKKELIGALARTRERADKLHRLAVDRFLRDNAKLGVVVVQSDRAQQS